MHKAIHKNINIFVNTCHFQCGISTNLTCNNTCKTIHWLTFCFLTDTFSDQNRNNLKNVRQRCNNSMEVSS